MVGGVGELNTEDHSSRTYGMFGKHDNIEK